MTHWLRLNDPYNDLDVTKLKINTLLQTLTSIELDQQLAGVSNPDLQIDPIQFQP